MTATPEGSQAADLDYNDAMSRVQQLDAESRGRVFADSEGHLSGRSDVAFALLYGSFLAGTPFRDIDVGIWTTDAADADLDLQLSGSLSGDLGVLVDVRRLNEVPVPFLFHVLRGRIAAARDEEFLASLMERVAREYHDHAPRLRRAASEAFAR